MTEPIAITGQLIALCLACMSLGFCLGCAFVVYLKDKEDR